MNYENICNKCKRKIKDFSFKCKYCDKYHCSKHRLPEDHNCEGLKRLKENNQTRWKKEFKQEVSSSKTYSEPKLEKSIEWHPSKSEKLKKVYYRNKRKIWKIIKWFVIIAIIFLLFQYYENNKKSIDNYISLTWKNISLGSRVDNLFKTDPLKYQTNPKTINLGNFNFIVYGGVKDYLAGLPRSISYYTTPPSDREFIMRDLNDDVQRYYLLPLVQKIQEQSTDKKQQANIAINLVQGIPYDWNAFTTNSVTGRYPYEVLYDMKGVCMEKSDLLAFILRDLGFGVVIFEFTLENHRAVGIKCSNGNYNTNYCFIEATDYYPVGQIPVEYVGGVDIRNAMPEVIQISDGESFS